MQNLINTEKEYTTHTVKFSIIHDYLPSCSFKVSKCWRHQSSFSPKRHSYKSIYLIWVLVKNNVRVPTASPRINLTHTLFAGVSIAVCVSHMSNSTKHHLAKIDKLSITGYENMLLSVAVPLLTSFSVRSFDNGRPETIQFHTPLTLIVGYNGSGKTVCIYLDAMVSLLSRFTDYHRMSQICHDGGSSPEQQRRGFHTRSQCMCRSILRFRYQLTTL